MDIKQLSLDELFLLKIEGKITVKQIAEQKDLNYRKLCGYYSLWSKDRKTLFLHKNDNIDTELIMPEENIYDTSKKIYRDYLIKLFNR